MSGRFAARSTWPSSRPLLPQKPIWLAVDRAFQRAGEAVLQGICKMYYQAITTKFHKPTDTRGAASGPAILGMLHELASLAAVATFVFGTGLAALALAPTPDDGIADQSAACELAAAEPTDFNIEQCTGEPIDLAPGRADW